MKDKLRGAIEALLEQLRQQQAEVAETKRTINSLCKRVGADPIFSDIAPEDTQSPPMRADQYYGKPLATAAQEYLSRRRQACKAEEILAGLGEGGFDFRSLGWKEKDRLRSFTISLAKNSKTFHRLPNGSFGLLEWYPEVPRRAAPRREEQQEGEAESEGPAPGDTVYDEEPAGTIR